MASGTENRYASIYIDGNAANDTISNLRKESRLLKNELDKLPRSSEEFAIRSKQLQQVEERLQSIRNEAKGVRSSFANLKEELVTIGKGMVAGLSVAGVIEAGRKIITQNAELSDSLAGVMKTTGLTQVEVESLNRSLSKLNTRTAKEELLGLAQVAGKLGISDIKQIEGFVRAADMIGVALGEDLGGTEQAVTSLGKLADIFKLKDEYGIEKALLKIGSAINSLGAAGTANEGYMIDFANRLAGIAPAANISIGDVLGLAATLDSLGQSGEKSSTAIGKFFVDMGNDTAKFAKIAKMDVGAFRDLLEKDAMEAFLKVLEASKSASGGVEEFAKNIGELGVKDAGAVAALGALSNNINAVREAQILGNQEIEKGTSIINEFETANNTLGGNLQKIWNKIGQIWESDEIRGGLTKLTGGIVGLIDKMMGVDETSRNITTTFNQQKSAFEENDKKVNDLLKTYDELKGKTNKSTEEQDLLNKTVSALSSLVPEAISQWDQYGRAIDINRGKVEKFTESQRKLFEARNKEVLVDLGKEFDKQIIKAGTWQKHATTASKILSSGKLGDKDLTDNQRGSLSGDYNRFNESKILDMGKAYDAAVAFRDAGGKITPAMDKIIKYFDGERPQSGTTGGTIGSAHIGGITSGGKSKSSTKGKSEAEREAERAKDMYDKLLKEDEAFKTAMDIADSSWYEQQLAKEAEQYDKQITKWEEFLSKKGITSEQKTNAEQAISDLESARDEAVAKRKIELEEEVSEKIIELREKLNNKLLTERDREEQSINNYYDALLEKYEGNGEMQATIEKNRAVDLANAKTKEEERFHKEAENLQQQAELAKKTGADRELTEMHIKIDAEIAALREKFSTELQETELFKQAEQEIIDRYNAEYDQKEKERTVKQREEIKQAALDSAQTISDAIFSINQANRDRELETALTKLDTQREKELSNKNLTESQKKAINAKYDALERKEKEKAWKAQQKADIIQAGINTALAVTRALPNWINAAAVAVAGAAQIAVISSQPVPQFYHGGYTNDEPQGWVRKPTVFRNSASGRAFSAGENFMSEYVVSSEQLRDPLVADFVSMMEAGRTAEIAGLMPQTTIVQQSVDNSKLEGLMGQLINAYNQSQNKKVVMVYSDLEEMRDTKVRIEYGANS